MTRTAFRIALYSTLAVMTLALIAWQWGLAPFAPRQPGGVALIGGPFTLVDHNGQTRTEQDYRGRLMLIYFGYTNCPDVCAMALQGMTVALGRLGRAAKQVQPIFITTDPARDTPAHLNGYVANFPGLVGLTGGEAPLRAAAKAYRVYSRKSDHKPHEGEHKHADYLVDHSSIVYLMDRDGRYLTHFSHTTPPETMAAKIAGHL
ncbi:MAG: SCO family protein [Alphaproteobacteria bacterium]